MPMQTGYDSAIWAAMYASRAKTRANALLSRRESSGPQSGGPAWASRLDGASDGAREGVGADTLPLRAGLESSGAVDTLRLRSSPPVFRPSYVVACDAWARRLG